MPSTRRGRRGSLLGSLAAAAVIAAGALPAASAQDSPPTTAGAEPVLTVDGGVASHFNSGMPVVARLTVGGSRLIKGTL